MNHTYLITKLPNALTNLPLYTYNWTPSLSLVMHNNVDFKFDNCNHSHITKTTIVTQKMAHVTTKLIFVQMSLLYM